LKHWLNILLAYDGSQSAKKGLEEAIRLGEKFNSKITVVNVCWEKTDDESRYILSETEEKLKKSKVRYNLRSERTENVPKRILDIIKNEGYDCVVLGARGFNAKDWLLGSVSTKIAAEAPCTVILSR
jgi:nucleotide-binding universal stress UspA family protein